MALGFSGVRFWLIHSILVICVSGFALKERATLTPTPISVAPSQNWDGDDGPWSSFTLRVGTPEQNVRVLISTANPDTWVVLPAGCAIGDQDCVEQRGRTFNYNTSSTWSQHGSYVFSTEQRLNLSAQAIFGNETLGLGIQGSGGPTLPDQIVGGFISEEFYLGMFGVNPASTNFTPEDQGRPSYLSTLRNQTLIPSLSFGYTAGNQYRLKQVLGSLTLGGVDFSRFTPSNLSIPFASDPSRNLMVGIQSITAVDQAGTKSDMLPTGIMSFVDSTVPQLWLPLEACQSFEKVFGLTFDETSELYLVNSTLHTQLVKQNASLTFTLGASTTGGQTTDIVLPYDSFDLLVTPPTNGVANNSKYFPLRRAANETQYTLGRTFLQEAYLTVDYERQNFSISQCVFNEDASQELVSIVSVNDKSSPSSSGGSSTGRTAGIAVAIVLGVLVIASAVGAYFCLKRRKSKRAAADLSKGRDTPAKENLIRQGFDKGELGTGPDSERYEMNGSGPDQQKPEERPLPGWVDEKANHPGDRSGLAEFDAGGVSVPELTGSQQGITRPMHEMYDGSASAPPIELPGDHPRAGELQGSNPTSAASSPRLFGRMGRGSNSASPMNHSSSTKRRSLIERFQGRSPASHDSTVDSVQSLESSSNPMSSSSSPPPPPRGSPPVGAGHSGEPFSPVSRHGTFSPDPISRQGTFTPEPVSRQGTFSADDPSSPPSHSNPFSPVSPSSPEASRGMFERPRGFERQGR